MLIYNKNSIFCILFSESKILFYGKRCTTKAPARQGKRVQAAKQATKQAV
jgi:hypothetical protein